jgi:hypothetical protein
MSHLARIENNVVVQVISCDDSLPEEGLEWVISTFGGEWIKTSYNGNFRKRFAGIGYTYSLDLDAFIPPKPFDSWILNEDTLDWDPPIPEPQSDVYSIWDEETLSWKELK